MEKFRTLIGKIPTGVLSGVTIIVILWLTLAPHPIGDVDLPLFPGVDKAVHIVMFAFLAFMVLMETMKARKWKMLSLALTGVIAILCAIFGLGIEIVQHAMGLGREFETADILADAGGAIGAGGIWIMIQEFFAKPSD